MSYPCRVQRLGKPGSFRRRAGGRQRGRSVCSSCSREPHSQDTSAAHPPLPRRRAEGDALATSGLANHAAQPAQGAAPAAPTPLPTAATGLSWVAAGVLPAVALAAVVAAAVFSERAAVPFSA